MLCLMFECEPRGYLKINGRVPSYKQLSLMLDCPQSDLEHSIDELRQAGVLSESKDGCIFSRRLVRDEEIRNKRSQAGKLGGNPAFAKGTPNPYYESKDKQKDKPTHKQRDNLPDKQNTEYEIENEDVVSKLKSTRKTNYEEIKSFCAELRLPECDPEYLFHHWESNGWTNGGKPIKSWKGTIRAWKAAGHLPSQKNGTPQVQKSLGLTMEDLERKYLTKKK